MKMRILQLNLKKTPPPPHNNIKWSSHIEKCRGHRQNVHTIKFVKTLKMIVSYCTMYTYTGMKYSLLSG